MLHFVPNKHANLFKVSGQYYSKCGLKSVAGILRQYKSNRLNGEGNQNEKICSLTSSMVSVVCRAFSWNLPCSAPSVKFSLLCPVEQTVLGS